MNRCDKRLAWMTGTILENHTKEHEHKELLKLGKMIPPMRTAFNLGEDWSPNTTFESGKRHHTVSASLDWGGVTLYIYLGEGDTLAQAIKFIAGHDERKNWKLHEKDNPESLPEGRDYYELHWTETGEWRWSDGLKIQIHFDTKAECKMVETGETRPVLKMVCNGNSSEAAEALMEPESEES